MAQTNVGINDSCSPMPDESADDQNIVGLKRKHEGEDNPAPRPAPVRPGSEEGCHEAQSTPAAAHDNKAAVTEDADVASTVPTHREVSAKRLIESLLQSDNPIQEIKSMEQQEQSLLTPYLWKEYSRLRNYKHEHKHSGEYYFPDADRALFLHDGSRIPLPEDEVHSLDIERRENGHTLRKKFRKRWKYSDEDSSSDDEPTGEASYPLKDGERPDDNSDSDTDEPGWTSWDSDDLSCKEHGQPRHLSERISSPLLYFRLVTVFGMPPPIATDEYKTCWEVTLRRIGGEESSIRLSESKGSPHASFHGHRGSSKSAFKLLSWLISDNIPYAFDGILAGSVAKRTLENTAITGVKATHNSIPVDQYDQLLSPHLWEEYRQLRDFEKDHKASCNGHYFPDADRVLFMHDGSRIPNPDCPTEYDSQYYAGRENGYRIRNAFLGQWGWDPDSSSDYRWRYELRQREAHEASESRGKKISWLSHNLYRDHETSGFQICDCDDCPGQDSDSCKKHPPEKCRPLHDYISSPLLYYRLTAVFEMPPSIHTNINNEKVCWYVKLHRYGDAMKSYLAFGESPEHRAMAQFQGGSVASESALRLLDWLVSDNVPHTYDGLLAGSVA